MIGIQMNAKYMVARVLVSPPLFKVGTASMALFYFVSLIYLTTYFRKTKKKSSYIKSTGEIVKAYYFERPYFYNSVYELNNF